MKEILAIGSRINHPEYGKGVVTNVTSKHYWVTFIDEGIQMVPVGADFEIIEAVEPDHDLVPLSEVEIILEKILRRWSDISDVTPIADRWKGGNMVFYPRSKELQEKEVPIDTFFHKIVMVRDRLRVMEQKINSSALSDAEKVELQQYITRIYGSLTTFNFLFKDKIDHFVGEKKSR